MQHSELQWELDNKFPDCLIVISGEDKPPNMKELWKAVNITTLTSDSYNQIEIGESDSGKANMLNTFSDSASTKLSPHCLCQI